MRCGSIFICLPSGRLCSVCVGEIFLGRVLVGGRLVNLDLFRGGLCISLEEKDFLKKVFIEN